MTKILECKNCKKKIKISFLKNDQSSAAKCKKKYCSIECKKEFLKNNGTPNSIRLICNCCNKTYFKPKSTGKNSKYCSRICQNKKQAESSKKKRKSIVCKFCSSTFKIIENSKQKYCSLKCSSSLKKTPMKDFTCLVCNKTTKIKINDTRKYCGRNCQYKAQSLGLIKIPTNGRSGYRVDLPSNFYFKSSLEADYARYLHYHNIDFNYEPKCFTLQDKEGNTRRYTPDFYIKEEDCYVETKARRRDGKYERNIECVQILANLGYNIKVVYMKEFYDKLKEDNEYDKIPNLERRNYKGTKQLIRN